MPVERARAREAPARPSGRSAGIQELTNARVLLVHEWLYTRGGAERVLEQLLALLPHADLLAGIVSPGMRSTYAPARNAIESWVGRLPLARRHHRWFLPVHAAAFTMYDTSGYDLVVSISHAFEKSIRAKKSGARHVSYCLSPPRYLWDLSESHDALAGPMQRAALRAARAPLRMVDRAGARGVHHFVSLSRHVADRVRRTYDRESTVVYPPVTAKPVSGRAAREPFLLTLGRLVPYKRVDVAVRAAELLGMRLVVVGDGPERGRLERMAGSQTTLLGHVSEQRAGELLSSCAAFVFCAEEDFGIAPVEANAHGAPVVAYARGGALETMRAGETATMFDEQSPEALAEAIATCLRTSWDEGAIRANAARFAPEHFRDGMRRELATAMAGSGG
jgi:glycosyltransferase involved in cell wall biosynthesis